MWEWASNPQATKTKDSRSFCTFLWITNKIIKVKWKLNKLLSFLSAVQHWSSLQKLHRSVISCSSLPNSEFTERFYRIFWFLYFPRFLPTQNSWQNYIRRQEICSICGWNFIYLKIFWISLYFLLFSVFLLFFFDKVMKFLFTRLLNLVDGTRGEF